MALVTPVLVSIPRATGATLLLILLLWLPQCTAEVTIAGTPMLELCERAANASWILFQGRLTDEPYNPGAFAWSLSHALRAFVSLYRYTGDGLWIDRAVTWVDHMANYTDVNADGRPAWGNYNETWGTDRYDFAEYTVHDGVICIPVGEHGAPATPPRRRRMSRRVHKGQVL